MIRVSSGDDVMLCDVGVGHNFRVELSLPEV